MQEMGESPDQWKEHGPKSWSESLNGEQEDCVYLKSRFWDGLDKSQTE